MSGIIAANGQVVTDKVIDSWSEALDKDEWLSGWKMIGTPFDGVPSDATMSSETLSIKVSSYLKSAIEREAKAEGKSASAFVRTVLTDKLVTLA